MHISQLTRFSELNYTNDEFNTKYYVMGMVLTLLKITRLESSKLLVGGIL